MGEVPADNFRISDLTTSLRSYRKMRFSSLAMESLLISMSYYVRKSAFQSPETMREKGDACEFMLELVSMSREFIGEMDWRYILTEVDSDLEICCSGAAKPQSDRLRKELDEALEGGSLFKGRSGIFNFRMDYPR